MKKAPTGVTILHLCITNDNHMMYGSWDMEYDRQNFLSFWAIFYPFTPLTTPKIKILKKLKKFLEISSFYSCVPQITIIWRMVPEILSATDRIFSHSGLFFALLPKQPENIILKKWKKHLEISSLYTSVPKIMIICYIVPEIWRVTNVIFIFRFGLFFSLFPS